jgi:hypothetical protein
MIFAICHINRATAVGAVLRYSFKGQTKSDSVVLRHEEYIGRRLSNKFFANCVIITIKLRRVREIITVIHLSMSNKCS